MRRPAVLSSIAMAAFLAVARPARAQQQDFPPITPQREYNGIVAGEQAYLENDARRQAELGRQFDLNNQMWWRYSGVSSWYPGVFEPWPLVPGNIVGWPAAVSQPRMTPTAVGPPNVIAGVTAPAVAAQRGVPIRPAAMRRAEPAKAAAKNPAPARATSDDKAAAESGPGGLLPGFAPATEQTEKQPAKPSGPRAF